MRLLYVVSIIVTCFTSSITARDLNNTVWSTNWNVMFFWQNGNEVNGEYIYDAGLLYGKMSGDTLRGWWREADNAKNCGPGNDWSGPLAFLFSADGRTFTGDWGYCDKDSSTLNLQGTAWTGTIKADTTMYTEAECTGANRYWCDSVCQISQCSESMTQAVCETAGRFWCNDSCGLVSCSVTSVNYFKQGKSFDPAFCEKTNLEFMDIMGRTAKPGNTSPQNSSLKIFTGKGIVLQPKSR